MTMLSLETLHSLCPLHVVLSPLGQITQAGPTMEKLFEGAIVGEGFFDRFEINRPRSVRSVGDLLATRGRKLHLRPIEGTHVSMKGLACPTGDGGVVIDCSFSISVIDAVRQYGLTKTDFAPTDLAIDMIFLMEAKSAAMNASRNLNTRLHGAVADAEKRAFTDALTGLHNRRGLDAALERISRQNCPYSVMQIDLDKFKQVNDTKGHAAGDHVLRSISQVMLEETRKEDTVARTGGDEFTIVLANLTSQRRLGDMAQRIIFGIETPVMFEGEECRISASIGISISDEGARDCQQMIDAADSVLYDSKHSGGASYRFASFESTEAVDGIGAH